MHRLDVKRVMIGELLAQHQGASLRVRDIMTIAPMTVGPELSVLEIARQMHAKHCRHLLVVEPDRRLLGVISDRDVIRCFGPAEYPDESVLQAIPASAIMSSDLVTISPLAPMVDAVGLMVEQGISCLPVLADGLLMGIVTTTDLFVLLEKLLRDRFPEGQTSEAATATVC